MEPFRRFRLLTVRLSLLVTAVSAGVAFGFDAIVAKSVMAGGIAGTLAFWITALRSEKLALGGKNPLQSAGLLSRVISAALYLSVLGWALTLDRTSARGVLAAGAGLFIVRVVAVILGLTGFDLEGSGRDPDGPHR